jgi:hypothetical protein
MVAIVFGDLLKKMPSRIIYLERMLHSFDHGMQGYHGWPPIITFFKFTPLQAMTVWAIR